MNTKQAVAHWVKCGIFYGYPTCCIAEFVACMVTFTQHKKRKLTGTGYVPCEKCNATKTEIELLETIQRNRKCPETFPIGKPIECYPEVKRG